jgi:hypothetical protein
MNKITQLLNAARDSGIDGKNLAQLLHHHFKISNDWQPTKKRPTRKHKKIRKRMQKASRKLNRGKIRGQRNHKGQRFIMTR